jgi:hypothetical protein
LLHIRSLAGYTIDMLESSFWKRQVQFAEVHVTFDCDFCAASRRRAISSFDSSRCSADN